MRVKLPALLLALGLVAGTARAETVARMYLFAAGAQGEALGTVHLADSKAGLRLTSRMRDLTPGGHSFHVRVQAPCNINLVEAEPPPSTTDSKAAPRPRPVDHDLPDLVVGADGVARAVLLAPGIRLDDIRGAALVVDDAGKGAPPPEALIACGAIPR